MNSISDNLKSAMQSMEEFVYGRAWNGDPTRAEDLLISEEPEDEEDDLGNEGYPFSTEDTEERSGR